MAIGTSTVTCDAGMRTSGGDLAGVIPVRSASRNDPLANQDGCQPHHVSWLGSSVGDEDKLVPIVI